MDSVYGQQGRQTFYGRKARRNYMIDTTWDESPLVFSVEITRATPMSIEEQRVVEQWLFNQISYKKFYIDPNDDDEDENSIIVNDEAKCLYLNCVFSNPTKLIYNGGVIGFSCTMECDSGFVWRDEIDHVFTDPVGQISVYVDSDVSGFIYPKVTIAANNAGNITITNNTDSNTRQTVLNSIPAASTITMNGEINYIAISGLTNPVAYNKFSGHKFIRLLKGENTLSVSGSINTMTLTWSDARYW